MLLLLYDMYIKSDLKMKIIAHFMSMHLGLLKFRSNMNSSIYR